MLKLLMLLGGSAGSSVGFFGAWEIFGFLMSIFWGDCWEEFFRIFAQAFFLRVGWDFLLMSCVLFWGIFCKVLGILVGILWLFWGIR